MRAAVKKKKNAGKKQFKFQYDPGSYALNFDDGGGGDGSSNLRVEVGNSPFQNGEFVVLQGFSETSVWIYVMWVECCN
ncbi:hypothetical protein Vadar_015010 [Vaccinium darrowii]|uniref:Uncharacterized protein n=1 Tax=Vaccinium darrowii TaxID=229202 RepID=A0ACB7X9U9_9ERIC|nr:hypothetical protein Vadar_015010 [Vaccinium darrowii]